MNLVQWFWFKVRLNIFMMRVCLTLLLLDSDSLMLLSNAFNILNSMSSFKWRLLYWADEFFPG